MIRITSPRSFRPVHLFAGLALAAVALAGCKKSESPEGEELARETQGAKAKPKSAARDALPGGPSLSNTSLDAWKIKLGLPAGAKVGEVESGEGLIPDSATLGTEGACGYDIDLSRHPKSDLDALHDSAKKASDGLSNVKYIRDKKTDSGYQVDYVGTAPLGDMYGVSRGIVVGDHVVVCEVGLGRLEQKEAGCVAAVCESITAQ